MITGLKAEESLKINNWKEPQVVFHLAIKRTSIQQKYSIPGDKNARTADPILPIVCHTLHGSPPISTANVLEIFLCAILHNSTNRRRISPPFAKKLKKRLFKYRSLCTSFTWCDITCFKEPLTLWSGKPSRDNAM